MIWERIKDGLYAVGEFIGRVLGAILEVIAEVFD